MLQSLNVSFRLGSCLRFRSSLLYRRMSPLHKKYHFLLLNSRRAVLTPQYSFKGLFKNQLTHPPTNPLRPVIMGNTCPSRITAAAGTRLAGAIHQVHVIIFLDLKILQLFTVIIYPILLDQACAHCPIFLTAALHGSLGLISVPTWLIILSDQLRISGLVSPLHYQQPNPIKAHYTAINLYLKKDIWHLYKKLS